MCTVLEYIFQVLMFSCDLFKELTSVNNHCNCNDFRPIKSLRKEGSRWWVNKLLDRFKFQSDSSIRTNLTLVRGTNYFFLYHLKMNFELCDTYYSE